MWRLTRALRTWWRFCSDECARCPSPKDTEGAPDYTIALLVLNCSIWRQSESRSDCAPTSLPLRVLLAHTYTQDVWLGTATKAPTTSGPSTIPYCEHRSPVFASFVRAECGPLARAWRVPRGRCCWTAQWHTAVCRADPFHVVRPCFGFQGSITFPLSSFPAGTSESGISDTSRRGSP